MDRVITTFRKNTAEEVRVSIGEYKGKQYASIRVYVENDFSEWIPTKKGITLSVDVLPELVRAVKMLEAEAIRAGLVEQENFEGARA